MESACANWDIVALTVILNAPAAVKRLVVGMELALTTVRGLCASAWRGPGCNIPYPGFVGYHGAAVCNDHGKCSDSALCECDLGWRGSVVQFSSCSHRGADALIFICAGVQPYSEFHAAAEEYSPTRAAAPAASVFEETTAPLSAMGWGSRRPVQRQRYVRSQRVVCMQVIARCAAWLSRRPLSQSTSLPRAAR